MTRSPPLTTVKVTASPQKKKGIVKPKRRALAPRNFHLSKDIKTIWICSMSMCWVLMTN